MLHTQVKAGQKFLYAPSVVSLGACQISAKKIKGLSSFG